MSVPIIHVEGLTKIYNASLKAADKISFDIETGEIFGLLGPNGAGKTTTILMLITLLKPTAGRASICGHDVTENPIEVRHCIGYVSQDVAVDDQLTGRENLMLQGHFYHMPRSLLKQRVEEVLSMVDLTERCDDLVSTYSGGMRKRLDIAEGLIHRPRILFLDEPTLGLDIQTRHKIWEYIRKLRSEVKMTIFLTTHYMDEADELCDRVAILDQGMVKVTGNPSSLKSKMGGDVITLKLAKKSSQVELVIQQLKELPSVGSVKQTGETYSIISQNGETAIPKICKIVDRLGGSLDAITLKRPSLDDVFLAYTGRALRAEESSHDAGLSERVRMMRIRSGG